MHRLLREQRRLRPLFLRSHVPLLRLRHHPLPWRKKSRRTGTLPHLPCSHPWRHPRLPFLSHSLSLSLIPLFTLVEYFFSFHFLSSHFFCLKRKKKILKITNLLPFYYSIRVVQYSVCVCAWNNAVAPFYLINKLKKESTTCKLFSSVCLIVFFFSKNPTSIFFSCLYIFLLCLAREKKLSSAEIKEALTIIWRVFVCRVSSLRIDQSVIIRRYRDTLRINKVSRVQTSFRAVIQSALCL